MFCLFEMVRKGCPKSYILELKLSLSIVKSVVINMGKEELQSLFREMILCTWTKEYPSKNTSLLKPNCLLKGRRHGNQAVTKQSNFNLVPVTECHSAWIEPT